MAQIIYFYIYNQIKYRNNSPQVWIFFLSKYNILGRTPLANGLGKNCNCSIINLVAVLLKFKKVNSRLQNEKSKATSEIIIVI